jgi:cytidyltransferase-like protein
MRENNPKNIVIVSGGFDPIHSGHICLIKEAKHYKNRNNYLIVLVNSDAWLVRKKGLYFLPIEERVAIIRSIKYVDEVVGLLDISDNDNTVTGVIEGIKMRYPHSKIIFANGGDRKKGNVPESKIKDIELIYGVGGYHKANSSSKILTTYLRRRRSISPKFAFIGLFNKLFKK